MPWSACNPAWHPHLLLLDLPRGDSDTLHILRWLRRLRPDLPVIVMCFPEDAERRREATRLGAQEVLVRPFDEVALESAISRYLTSSENGRQAEIDSQDIEQLGPDDFFRQCRSHCAKASGASGIAGRSGRSGSDSRRNGQRQGHSRPTDSQAFRPLRFQVPQGQLRRHAGGVARGRTVRERRHGSLWRRTREVGKIRARRKRHDLPG